MRHTGAHSSKEGPRTRRSAPASVRRWPGGRGPVGAALRLSLAAWLAGASPGCSLFLTKGPQPELHPPPECTTSVVAPVVDTVLSATAVALAIAVLAESRGGPCASTASFGSVGCVGEEIGDVLGVAGGALGALFGVSAGFGYARTSACRASLGPGDFPAPTQRTPTPETSLWQTPTPGCLLTGDAPRVCGVRGPADMQRPMAHGAPR